MTERLPVIRVCLDLNIWIADLISTARGKTGGSSTWLVNAVRDGACAAGPLQLVVSLGMMDRLEDVLRRRFSVSQRTSRGIVNSLAAVAGDGPLGEGPSLVLGGTGILPLTDTEDRGVLEAAVAGGAHILATANLRDFRLPGAEGDDRLRVHQQPGRPRMLILHPDEAAGLLREGGERWAKIMENMAK